MTISSNHTATAAKYAQAVLTNPKLQLSEGQQKDVEAIAKKHTVQIPDEFAQANALSSLASNPYNPFYGVSSPYNYSNTKQAAGQTQMTSQFYKNLTSLNSQLDVKHSAASHKFQLLRAQL